MGRAMQVWLRRGVIPAVLLLMLAACGGGGSTGSNSSSKALTSVTVSGTVSYEDRVYDVHGFTGDTTYKSLRYAVVDLVDSDGTVIATTATDDDGHYSLQGKGSGLYVRVLAQTTAAAGTTLSVNTFDGDAFAISKSLTVDDKSEVTADIPISLDNSIAGVFNMLDVYSNASQFVASLSKVTLPDMKVFWQSASSSYGTYFCPANYNGGPCPQGKGIYILGGSDSGGDTDEYDDDVLMHEYGHYVETTLGLRDSPGGSHYLNDDDLRLSWSEGWGSFFPVALKSWLKEYHPERLSSSDELPTSYFVDTYGSAAGISIDMASPNVWYCPGGSDCFIYSSSEVAVTKVLAGLQQAFGMQAVWDVYSGYMANGTTLPATLETLWDGWLQQRAPAAKELQTLHEIFGDRQVFYREDGFESDNGITNAQPLTVCPGLPCDAEQHFLYRESVYSDNPHADTDLFAINVHASKNYLVETLDLGNGADTYVRLLDEYGNVVFDDSGQALVNDDRPGTTYCYPSDNPCRIHYDDTMLSSSITFTARASGTYYVEVKTSPDHPQGAGRYGTYSIRARRL
jgi:hypothetical protein